MRTGDDDASEKQQLLEQEELSPHPPHSPHPHPPHSPHPHPPHPPQPPHSPLSPRPQPGSPTEQQQPRGRFHHYCTLLYGDISLGDLKKSLWLSATMFCMIGAYWLLRSLKDSVFAHLVGLEYQPKAKMLSVVVVLLLLFLYNKLLDIFDKFKLFLGMGVTFAALITIVALFLAHPAIGLENPESSPDRILGWISYFTIESFGSLSVSLFWSFVNSNVSVESAKSSYGLIIAGAQIGSILGPTMATSAPFVGVPLLYCLAGAEVLLMVWLMVGYKNRFGIHPPVASDGTGVLEGLRLLFRHKYVMGIFFITSCFEIVVTIMDFQMKVLAKAQFTTPADFTLFLGRFGQATNSLSFVFSLVGTSFVIRRLGLGRTLAVYPVLVMATVVVVFAFPALWVLFACLVFVKGLNYALNNPSREMLYGPTSDSVKYKAKSWIDMFGGRGAKALGSVATNAFKHSPEVLLINGSVLSFSLGASLLAVSLFMGREFQRLTTHGIVIGRHTTEEKLERTMPV